MLFSLVSSRHCSTLVTISCSSRIWDEDAGVGGEAGLAAALLGQAELVEEDLGELLRRADRELVAGQLEDLGLEGLDPLLEALADVGQALLRRA